MKYHQFTHTNKVVSCGDTYRIDRYSKPKPSRSDYRVKFDQTEWFILKIVSISTNGLVTAHIKSSISRFHNIKRRRPIEQVNKMVSSGYWQKIND
jgi:hypothetical protein